VVFGKGRGVSESRRLGWEEKGEGRFGVSFQQKSLISPVHRKVENRWWGAGAFLNPGGPDQIRKESNRGGIPSRGTGGLGVPIGGTTIFFFLSLLTCGFWGIFAGPPNGQYNSFPIIQSGHLHLERGGPFQ